MSSCKYCGSRIKWIETERGKMMPVEPDIVESCDVDDGTILITEDGHTTRIKDGFPEIAGYIPHFKECPDYKGS